jgi:hypothetical protein
MAHRGGSGGGVVSGLASDTFQGDTLGSVEAGPAERALAEAVIARHARDEDDRQLLHDAVFAAPRKARKHGDKPSPEWAEARSKWLARCRDWVEAEGGRVLTTAQIPEADQRAYEAATGDVWVSPPTARPGADGREKHYPTRCRSARSGAPTGPGSAPGAGRRAGRCARGARSRCGC